MSRSTFVKVCDWVVPNTGLPTYTFLQDLRGDSPRYFILQDSVVAGSTLVQQDLGFESSFVSIHSLIDSARMDTIVGYIMIVKRGKVRNLGVSLLIGKSTTLASSEVDLPMTQHNNLGNFLKVFKLGDSAIFLGVNNPDALTFFY